MRVLSGLLLLVTIAASASLDVVRRASDLYQRTGKQAKLDEPTRVRLIRYPVNACDDRIVDRLLIRIFRSAHSRFLPT